MHSTQKIGLLMATVAVLAACGATSEPLSGLSPPPPPAPGAPPPPPPPAVACTAPDPVQELGNRSFVGACFPNLKAVTSQRTDFLVGSDFVDEYTINYTDSTSCQGSNTVATNFYDKADIGTATLASIAADGVTPVTGTGYQMEVNFTDSTGGGSTSTFGTTGSTTFTLCKASPSTATLNVSPYFNNFPQTITPTFSIRLSLPNTPTIVATPVFDEVGTCFYNCG
jgi:hypothetical protein